MYRAYLFALDPTPAQVSAFRSHCGAQRFAYNWAVERLGKIRAQRSAEYSYGLRGAELTPCSAYDLRRTWNAVKAEVAPWWPENSKETYSSGLANAATAFKNFGDSWQGKRRGPKVRYPRFKGRRARLSCRFTTGAFGLAADRRHVRLPVIGTVRTHESTRKLARRVEAGAARIVSATLSYQRGRWHVSFGVELPDREPEPRRADVVGVDLGIKQFAVLSTGETVTNPRRLDRELAQLRRLQRAMSRRRGPDKRRPGVVPSRRWCTAKRSVTRLHTRVANHRRDELHKLTTRLADQYATVVVEDLNVAGMQRNKRLSRHIAGLGMAEFRRQLAYKTDGLVVADRWYPSSKTCSACGAVRAKLTLSERVFECYSCGTRIDRDRNAALNLAALADRVVLGELRPDVKETVGNACKTTMGGSAYSRGPTGNGERQAPAGSQRHHREVMAR